MSLTLAFGIAVGVSAGQITVSANIDLDTARNGTGLEARVWLNEGAVSIGSGDSVEMTVSFDNNRALKIVDGNEFLPAWLFAGGNDSSFTISNVLFDLIGFSGLGGASSSYYIPIQSGGIANLGPSLFSWSFLEPGQEVTFSGFNVSFNVDSLSVDPHVYSELWFVNAYDFEIVDVHHVPDASALVLMLLGLGSIFVVRCRKPIWLYLHK